MTGKGEVERERDRQAADWRGKLLCSGEPMFMLLGSKGSKDGGDRRAASGRERGHPRLHQLLMHLREKRHWSRTRL